MGTLKQRKDSATDFIYFFKSAFETIGCKIPFLVSSCTEEGKVTQYYTSNAKKIS